MVQKQVAGVTVTPDNGSMPPKISFSKTLLKSILPPPPEVDPLIVPEDDSERRPTTPHLSFSQLAMILRCGAQYRFRYVLGLKERPKVSLSIGKGGHAALEWNTKTKIRTGEDEPEEAVVQKASDMMDFYLREVPLSESEVDTAPGATKDKFLAATRVYRRRDAPGITPVGAEVEFNLDMNEYVDEPLPEPIRIVNGKIDLVYDDTTTTIGDSRLIRVGVEDTKFVMRKRSQADVNLSVQLSVYATVMHKLTGRFPTKLGYRMMHPGTTKDPADSIVLNRDPALMTPDLLERRMKRVAFQFREAERMIRESIFIPTDDPITCSWCGYRERCQKSLVDDIEAATIRQNSTPTGALL
jgi:hypothetical protein